MNLMTMIRWAGLFHMFLSLLLHAQLIDVSTTAQGVLSNENGVAFIDGVEIIRTVDVHFIVGVAGSSESKDVDAPFRLLKNEIRLTQQVRWFCYDFSLSSEDDCPKLLRITEELYKQWLAAGNSDCLGWLKPRSGIILHSSGDSHSALLTRDFLDYARTYVNVDLEIHWSGPKLMNTVVRDSLLLDLDRSNILATDIVMFVYGYIDISHHQYKFFPTQGFGSINSLVTSYFESIDTFRKLLPETVSIWVHGIVPPVDLRDPRVSKSYSDLQPEAIRANSTMLHLKVMWTIAMNFKIRQLCASYNFVYIDMFDEYADENGFLRREHIFRTTHVTNYTNGTKTLVADSITHHIQQNLVSHLIRPKE